LSREEATKLTDEPEIITLVDEHRFVCLECDWKSQPFKNRMSKKKLATRNEAHLHVTEEHPEEYSNPYLKLKIMYLYRYTYDGEENESHYPNSIPEPLVLYALKRALRTSIFSKRVPAYEVSRHLRSYFRRVWGSPRGSTRFDDSGVYRGHDEVIKALNRLWKRGIIQRDIVELSSAYSHAISKQSALGEFQQAQGVGYGWKKKVAHFSLKEDDKDE
jgi:hypothetical protein